MLRFKAQAAVFGVADAVFPIGDGVKMHIIPGIKMDSRFGGEGLYADAALFASRGAGGL